MVDWTQFKEFAPSGAWLNTTAEEIVSCQGQVIILSFVNANSVWCMQRLTALMRLQQRHPNEIQVVVVYVPRFDYERQAQCALSNLESQGIQAPAILDSHWEIWEHFGVTSWPTFILFDVDGKEWKRSVGEDLELEKQLKDLLDVSTSVLKPKRYRFVEKKPRSRASLCYPRAVLVANDHLYIADAGHHRILECTLQGRILRCFGRGTPGLFDSDTGQVAFCYPSGLAFDRGFMYVADSGNNALRRITLSNGRVDTLCGNGRVGRPTEGRLSSSSSVCLDAPYGLCVVGNTLYIALAGDNTLWGFQLQSYMLNRITGRGSLECRDGYKNSAGFAQPMALAGHNQCLYICDALSSSIRTFQIQDGQVRTMVGGNGVVWEFGCQDGARQNARLQCPQAIALDGVSSNLWIADTGNGILRCLRFGQQEITTVPLPRTLQAPTGLAITGKTAFIAESHSHTITRYDIHNGSLVPVAIADPDMMA